MQIGGSWTAIITPFKTNGSVDVKPLEQFVDWQIEEGVDGIVCAGSTGEGASLNEKERKKVVEICVEVAAKRVPVVAGTGTNDTKQSVKYTEMAMRAGAQGCLVITPYYCRPTQKGCLLHCQEIAKVGLPIIVYMNPPRTGVKLTLETVEALREIREVVALKDSNHDLELFKKMQKILPIFSGDDDFTFSLMKEGAVGSIGVLSNLIPRGWKQMIDLCLKRDWKRAEELFEQYMPLCKAIFSEVNPQGIKFALAWLGQCLPVWRLPLLAPEISAQKQIKKAILNRALPPFHSCGTFV
jgi:4-hydroxy-tetrahydrodipicolinate synthase